MTIKGSHLTEIANDASTVCFEMEDVTSNIVQFTYKYGNKQDWLRTIRAQLKLFQEQEALKRGLE